MFPYLFKDLIVESFHRDDCEITKHKCISFPISHKRCQTPFSLTHSDIWGPSPIPNIFGAWWFLSLIKDCTRITWIYLLNKKTGGSQILSTFFNMIKTQYDVPNKRFWSDNAKDYFNQNLSVSSKKRELSTNLHVSYSLKKWYSREKKSFVYLTLLDYCCFTKRCQNCIGAKPSWLLHILVI